MYNNRQENFLKKSTLFFQFPIQIHCGGFVSTVDVDNVGFSFYADAFAGAGEKEEAVAIVLNVKMTFFYFAHSKSIGFEGGNRTFVLERNTLNIRKIIIVAIDS